ncbi:hypothetical protein DRN97_03020 [Methanosarcinales archaeon]|nr:MAG: hypothetical protein DRN97_03020 [Methanosarcinales archaeon]
MTLSEEQLEQLYRITVENRRDIEWIRNRLQQGNSVMDSLNQRLKMIESESAYLRGRIGAFLIFFAFAISLGLQGLNWIFSYFWRS